MKKVTTLFGLLLLSMLFSNPAFCDNPKKEKGFEVNMGVTTGVNTKYGFIYYGLADVSMGYRINHHLYVGAGFELMPFDMTTRFYQDGVYEQHYYYGQGMVDELAPIYPNMSERFLLPVYITIRYTILNTLRTNVSPLLRVDLGYQFSSKYFEGFFGDFNVGCDFRNNQRFGIYLCLGVRIEQNPCDIMNWQKKKQSPFVRFPDIKFGFRF